MVREFEFNITNVTTAYLMKTTNAPRARYDYWFVCSCILAIGIISVNTITILLMRKKPSLLRSPSNCILFSMAIADFLTGAVFFLHLIGKVTPSLLPLKFMHRIDSIPCLHRHVHHVSCHDQYCALVWIVTGQVYFIVLCISLPDHRHYY